MCSGTQVHSIQQNAGKSGTRVARTQVHSIQQNAGKNGTQVAGTQVHSIQQNAGKSGTRVHSIQQKVEPRSILFSKMCHPQYRVLLTVGVDILAMELKDG